jgi:hypothetical protein
MVTDMKTCCKCKESKELTEFNKHKGNKDGLQYTCNPCRKAIAAEYYIKTIEAQAARGKRYREANIEKVRATRKRYYQENKEKILARQKNEHTKEYNKKYYLEHSEKSKARASLWRKENPEYAKAISRAWREAHPEQKKLSAREYAKKQRAKLSDSYIKAIFNHSIGGSIVVNNIPKELIEAKRLQILINRRIKDENSNTTT